MESKHRKQIYLDYNASTPIDPAVQSVLQQASARAFGNPSSHHWAGLPAREIVEDARQKVAGLLGCKSSEIIFTSGGSESNNQVIKSAYFSSQAANPHIITTRIEHPAIVEPCRFLERLGARITWLPADDTGCIDPEDLRQSITRETILVSIMHANNEVGTIQPIKECAQIARMNGIPFHTDAAQSIGKIPTRVDDLGVDFLSIAGHKLYAPKGIGALFVRNGMALEPLVHGAGHELGRRAGTESALLTAALGAACDLARDLSGMDKLRKLRDRLWTALRDGLPGKVVLNGHFEKRLPNTLNVSFLGHVGHEILEHLPELAASTGSACHTGQVEISPVLKAMGISEAAGAGAVRFSLGRSTNSDEIDSAINQILPLLRRHH